MQKDVAPQGDVLLFYLENIYLIYKIVFYYRSRFYFAGFGHGKNIKLQGGVGYVGIRQRTIF